MNGVRRSKSVKLAKNKARSKKVHIRTKKVEKNKMQIISRSAPSAEQNGLMSEACTRKRLKVVFDEMTPFGDEWRARAISVDTNEFFNECVKRISNNNPGENMEILSSSKMCTMELHIVVRTLCLRGFVVSIRHIIYQRDDGEETVTPVHQCVLWQSGQDVPAMSNEFHFALPVDPVVELYELIGSINP